MIENPEPNSNQSSEFGVCLLQSDPPGKTVETEAYYWCDEWVEDVLQTHRISWIAMCCNCTQWKCKSGTP